jgi:uncharacterized protein YjeT (DUF2065 family)
MEGLIALTGLVLILEGVFYFVAPGGMKSLLARILRLPDQALRFWGAVAMALGLFLVYLGRS